VYEHVEFDVPNLRLSDSKVHANESPFAPSTRLRESEFSRTLLGTAATSSCTRVVCSHPRVALARLRGRRHRPGEGETAGQVTLGPASTSSSPAHAPRATRWRPQAMSDRARVAPRGARPGGGSHARLTRTRIRLVGRLMPSGQSVLEGAPPAGGPGMERAGTPAARGRNADLCQKEE
jgi:hypothetical protein